MVAKWAESPVDTAAVAEMQMATGVASVQYRLGKHFHDLVVKRYSGRSILVTILAVDTFSLHIDSSFPIWARTRAAQIVDRC